jgi:hypothetical protein
MTNAINAITASVLEKTVVQGDLAMLTSEQRLRYYLSICNSIGFNPHTRPLEYIRLNGKLTLYCKRDATDQLRKLHGVSLHVLSRDESDGILTVAVRATTRDGRTDEDIGAVPMAGLKGEARCNAAMKALTGRSSTPRYRYTHRSPRLGHGWPNLRRRWRPVLTAMRRRQHA